VLPITSTLLNWILEPFMAKPNYQFDKRQRELKKEKQQEEKRLKKLARNETAEASTTKQEQTS
jgi:hypothetical protein